MRIADSLVDDLHLDAEANKIELTAEDEAAYRAGLMLN